jgi:ribosomal protein L11 methyltransferase
MLMARLPTALAQTLTHGSFQDRDWEQAYRQHFKPLQCAAKLWIVPSWIEPPDPAAVNVRLDPGLAFGTGGHPTTALCLAWLGEQALDGLELIDYGCGSGILAIAAIKLGARRVLAVDIDPQALSASRANMEMNAIPAQRIPLCLPRDCSDDAVDLLMANILAGPLVELAPLFADRVRPGGKILLSGILNTQLKDIQSAYDEYFHMDAARERDDWVCIAGQRRDV